MRTNSMQLISRLIRAATLETTYRPPPLIEEPTVVCSAMEQPDDEIAHPPTSTIEDMTYTCDDRASAMHYPFLAAIGNYA